jgi:hypothetical protein
MWWNEMESQGTYVFVRKIGKSAKISIPVVIQEDLKGRVVKVSIEIIK